MIKNYKSEVICDLAETYNVYDYRSFSVFYIAELVNGLRPNSRVKMAIAETEVASDELLLAGILDRLSTLVWFQTKDGQNGKRRPKSVVESLISKKDAEKQVKFDSVSDFEKARAKFIKKGKEG